jgi:hypothetical protein
VVAWLVFPVPKAQQAGPSAKATTEGQGPLAAGASGKEKPQPRFGAAKEPDKTPAQPAADPPAAPPVDEKLLVLSDLDKRFESYHELIKPHAGEWKFASIPWVPTVWEARKKAADEGKPLFIWSMAGEPLGQC